MFNLQTESSGVRLSCEMLSGPSHLPFFLLNRKAMGLGDPLWNIQNTPRAGTLWVLLKNMQEGGTNMSGFLWQTLSLCSMLGLLFNFPAIGQCGLHFYLFMCEGQGICPLMKVQKLGNDRAEIWSHTYLTLGFLIHRDDRPGIFLMLWKSKLLFTIKKHISVGFFIVFLFFSIWDPKLMQQRRLTWKMRYEAF